MASPLVSSPWTEGMRMGRTNAPGKGIQGDEGLKERDEVTEIFFSQ